jgi:hypothetical protein
VDSGSVVLAAASAIAAVAEVGILLFSRPAGPREAGFVAIPAAGLAALLVLAWRTHLG